MCTCIIQEVVCGSEIHLGPYEGTPKLTGIAIKFSFHTIYMFVQCTIDPTNRNLVHYNAASFHSV